MSAPRVVAFIRAAVDDSKALSDDDDDHGHTYNLGYVNGVLDALEACGIVPKPQPPVGGWWEHAVSRLERLADEIERNAK